MIVEELALARGKVRLDVALVNETLSGFEIKSDVDSLERLPRQLSVYGRVLDELTLVTTPKHLDRSIEQIPSWVGILVASMPSKAVRLRTVRRPRRSPNTDPYVLAQLLWRSEALSLLESQGAADGVRSKSRHIIAQKIAETIPISSLKAAAADTLRTRSNWRWSHNTTTDSIHELADSRQTSSGD